jgi:hypothetical protein
MVEMTALRGEVFNILRRTCNCDPLQYPQILRDFFEAWLDQELARLERKVEIQREEQRLELLFIEFKSLYSDYYHTKERSRLQQILLASSIRNLSSAKIRPSVLRLSRFIGEEVYPLFHLMYGEELKSVEGLKVLDALLQKSLTQSFLQNLDDLVFAAAEMEAELSKAQRHTPSSGGRQVGIVFPRDALGSLRDPWKESPYPRASSPLAKHVWKAIDAGAKVTIALSPEQLYAVSGEGTLDCIEAIPIIRSMAVAFSYEVPLLPEGINRRPLMITAEVKNMLFPTEMGPEVYAVASQRLRYIKPKLIFGKGDELASLFQTHASALKAANGLSPFGVMELDFSFFKQPQYRELMDGAKDVSLIFELDSLFVDPAKMSWIQNCRSQ